MSCCGPPKKCCSCSYTPPTQEDECRCGCGYRNGVFQILCAQFLLFCAFWFGMATIGDCAFVQIESPIVVRQDGATATRLGMLSYTQEDGSCYYWDETIIDRTTGRRLFGDQQVEYYIRTVLGQGWYAGSFVAAAAVGLAFLLFLYVTSFCCSTQVRGVRMFVGLLLSVVLVILQGLSFLILSSQWCADEGCVMDRSAAFSIAAACCLFLSGTFFFFMSNYPGKAALAQQTNADIEAPPIMVAAAAVEEGEPKELEAEQEEAFPEGDEYPAPPSENGGERVDENEMDPTGETEKLSAESEDIGDDEEAQKETTMEADAKEPEDDVKVSADETTLEEPQEDEPAGDKEASAETEATEDEAPSAEESQVQEESAAADTQYEEEETDSVLDEELERPPPVPTPSKSVS